MAVEYRNLRKEFFPNSLEHINNLKAENNSKDEKISNLKSEIFHLREIKDNNENDIQNLKLTLKHADDTIAKQNRTIKRLKWLTYSCGAISLILGGLVLGSAM